MGEEEERIGWLEEIGENWALMQGTTMHIRFLLSCIIYRRRHRRDAVTVISCAHANPASVTDGEVQI
jgi:hypothetical protein